jgi:exodeoxyribonuclease VII small subunit
VAEGSPADIPPGATFEDLMAELEEVTERLAAGDLGIEAAADLYERAELLHSQAAERLAQVQARVESLTRHPGPGVTSDPPA